MNSIDLKPDSSSMLRRVLRVGKGEALGVEYDRYQWALPDSPGLPSGRRRASALVIRSKGEIVLNGSVRRVDQGDILIIPPGTEQEKGSSIDLFTLLAAVLILLAWSRGFLDLC